MNTAIVVKKAEKLLAMPDSFRRAALSFPDKVDQALEVMGDAGSALPLIEAADAMTRLAKRIGVDTTEVVNSIQFGKLKLIAYVGEKCPAAPESDNGKKGGRGNKKAIQPERMAFSPQTLSKYRKVTANQDKLEDYREKCGNEEELTLGGFVRFATGTEKAGAAAHVSANTGVPEWYTPAEYIEAARAVLGAIDLDPASSALAQETVRAVRFYTLDDDGLSREWAGRVWLNPPYSSDLVAKFVAKLCQHVEAGNDALLLVNNATETRWFQRAAKLSKAICFPAGRVKFLDEQGVPGAPLQGQAVLYFGGEAKAFMGQFKPFGFCVQRGK